MRLQRLTEDTLQAEYHSAWDDMAAAWLWNYTSEATRRAYKTAYRLWLEFIENPSETTPDDVIRFRYHLQKRGASASTINNRLAAISALYQFAIGRGMVAANPCDGVQRLSVTPYGKAKVLDVTDGADVKLLASIKRDSVTGKRDYALLLFMLVTGLRVGAVAGATIGRLRAVGMTLYYTYPVKGRGTAERRLPDVVTGALVDYINARDAVTGLDAALFANENHDPLTARGIQQLVRARCNRVFGAGHGFTPHALRHTAAVAAIASGASVQDVQALLGHRNLAVTSIYLQHIREDAADVGDVLASRYGA